MSELQPISREISGIPVKVTLVESSSRPGGVRLVDANAVVKVSDPQDLVEMARQIQKADEFVRANAMNKLSVIVDQVKYLQQQARKVLAEAKRDDQLHHAACNLKKVPGTIYHLYQRPSGQQYFSILSPQEWGPSCPHTFLGSFKLESDMSWTPADKLVERQSELKLLEGILNAQMGSDDNSPLFTINSNLKSLE